jgi:hypothetical protein
MAQFCCSAPVFDEQPMKHCPQVGAVPNIPMTADVTSLAEMTDVSCSGVHGAGRASAGTSAAVSAGAAVVAASSGGEVGVKDEGSLLAQAIAQLVESFALAHAIRHCPHGGLLPISAITADVLSAAVPTFVTSAIVHAADGTAAFGTAVAALAVGAVVITGTGVFAMLLVAQAIAQLVESFALAHAIRHCPHGGLLPISATTADVLSAAVPTFVTSAIVHAAAEDTLACRVVISREAASAPATKELSKISTAIMTADI